MAGSLTKRGAVFLGVFGLRILMTPSAAAQGDPKTPPARPAQDPGDAGTPEPPSESPPPAPAPEPPPSPPPPPEEPITLPEEPPSPAPPPQPPPPSARPEKPPRAAFPAPPPSEQPRTPPAGKLRTAPAEEPRVAPAPKPHTTQQRTTAPTANSERVKQPEPKTKGKDEEKEDSSDGLFGPFRIGGLVGVGLPSVLSFGGAIKLTRYLGGGLNIGLIPTVRISLYGEAKLSYQEYDVYGRLFPFGNMFFVGAGVGYATITGSFRSSYDVRAYQSIAPNLPDTLDVESKGSVRTLVLTPQIGVQHTFGSGFTLGIDAGLQIPLAPSEVKFSTQLPPGVPPEVIEKYVKPNDQKVRDTLETIGRATVPTLNLRIGWLL